MIMDLLGHCLGKDQTNHMMRLPLALVALFYGVVEGFVGTPNGLLAGRANAVCECRAHTPRFHGFSQQCNTEGTPNLNVVVYRRRCAGSAVLHKRHTAPPSSLTRNCMHYYPRLFPSFSTSPNIAPVLFVGCCPLRRAQIPGRGDLASMLSSRQEQQGWVVPNWPVVFLLAWA